MLLLSKTVVRKILVFVSVTSVMMFIGVAGTAHSFPFRVVSQGELLPPLTFTPLAEDGPAVSTQDLQGHPFALVFWGADIVSKKKRSIKAVQAIESIGQFLRERQVRVLLVNAQGDNRSVIDEALADVSHRIPVYTDTDRRAYAQLGIFIVPSVLLVDGKGRIAAGIGYRHDFRDRLKGEIQVMLGEISRADIERKLRPEMVEKTSVEKESARHFKTALVMVKRGQTDSAIAELKKALEIDPEMREAQAQLGCLYLDKGWLDKAKQAVEASLVINRDFLQAQICAARLMAAEGEVDSAVEDLKALLFRHARDANLHFVLGTLYELQQKDAEAASEYRKAYELVNRHIEFD